jgi:hypothetical protein
VVIASRQDYGEAVQLARFYSERLAAVRVVLSTNGWYAVVSGPHQVDNAQTFKQGLIQSGRVPGDAFLSKGDVYVEQVWDTTKEARRDPIAASAPPVAQSAPDPARLELEQAIKREREERLRVEEAARVASAKAAEEAARAEHERGARLKAESAAKEAEGQVQEAARREADRKAEQAREAQARSENAQTRERAAPASATADAAQADLSSDGPPLSPIQRLRQAPLPVSAPYGLLASEVGCSNPRVLGEKQALFNQQYKDRDYVWRGTVLSSQPNRVEVQPEGGDGRRVIIEMIEGQNELSTLQNATASIRFKLRTLGTCLLPFRGDQGLVVQIGERRL